MKRVLGFFGLGLALALTGCATHQSAVQQANKVQEAYTLLVDAEVAYAKSPLADVTVVARMKQVDSQLYPVLVRYRAAAEVGATPLSSDLVALASGLSTIDDDLVKAKVLGPSAQAVVSLALSALNAYVGG